MAHGSFERRPAADNVEPQVLLLLRPSCGARRCTTHASAKGLRCTLVNPPLLCEQKLLPEVPVFHVYIPCIFSVLASCFPESSYCKLLGSCAV